MRILQLHNRYQIVGGEEGVVQAEQALLRDRGHDVALLEVSNDEIVGVWNQAIAAASAVYSQSSKAKVTAAIEQFQPDIVHVHNFFPLLSPSVYDACRSKNIPVVQTLHNYRLGCPRAMFFRDNQICEDCLGKTIPLAGIVHGCYRGSRPQSAVVTAMVSWHRLRGTWQERVNAYITLTQFQKEKLSQAGLPTHKIYVKPNFVFAPEPAANFAPAIDDYALFVGRLAEEKGVAVLIAAYVQNGLTLPLKIVGEGPLRDSLEQQVRAAGLEQTISFLGRQEKAVVLELMQQAKFLVFPSIWYEGFPLTIAEAFACALPVIVPQLGSMAEIVEDRVTGLHFAPRDATDLASKIVWAHQHPETIAALGRQARLTYEAKYTPAANFDQLMGIYKTVLGQ
ncbi:MAG: glycosyltransferase family 4 protein [Leptolyngbyaceae cyanobacterium SU_3_3]|nr:glycosyltransferase family 4 protein [Leptolyngbyaceae cyanobacterium SU_3_3]NJR50264.1 glycosyltransferase family 4 protein [Leptolyngbyaceae cyanobacterium CSU_1_3]